MWNLSGIALAANQDGRLELMAIANRLESPETTDLWHRWERLEGGWSDWESLGEVGGESGAAVRRPAVARDKHGCLAVAAVGSAEHAQVYGAQQQHPGRAWIGWLAFGDPGGHGTTSLVALGRNTDRRLELFAADAGGGVWHKWQDEAGHWQAWRPLGRPVGQAYLCQLAVAPNKDGRLELFITAENQAVWHCWQRSEGGWSDWESLGTPAGRVIHTGPVVARNKDGRLELFITADDRTAWHCWQRHAGGWSDWESLGRPGSGAADVAAGAHADGRLVLFATTWSVEQPHPAGAEIRYANGLFHREQTTPGGGWSDWDMESFDIPPDEHGVLVTVQSPALALNADGRLELFAPMESHTGLYRLSQSRPSGSGWEPQRVDLQPPPHQVLTADGPQPDSSLHPRSNDTGQHSSR